MRRKASCVKAGGGPTISVRTKSWNSGVTSSIYKQNKHLNSKCQGQRISKIYSIEKNKIEKRNQRQVIYIVSQSNYKFMKYFSVFLYRLENLIYICVDRELMHYSKSIVRKFTQSPELAFNIFSWNHFVNFRKLNNDNLAEKC